VRTMADRPKKINPTRKAMMIAGLIFVAGAGYWYFSRTDEDKDNDATTANDTQTPVSIGQPIEEITRDMPKIEEEEQEDDVLPNENHIEDIEDDPAPIIEEPKVEPEEPKQPIVVIQEEEPQPEPIPIQDDDAKDSKEDDTVIVTKEEEEEPIATADDDEKEKEKELEAQKAADLADKIEEENRLKETIKKNEEIAAKVAKMPAFKYKNGKLKVTLLRATDIEDKDKSLTKGDLSDVLVKFKVPGGKHRKSSIVKDSRNPVWKGQVFVFDVINPLKDRLSCAVLDHDTMVNDYIGNVEVPIIDVVKAENATLKDAKFAIKGSKKGCLYLDLVYYEKTK